MEKTIRRLPDGELEVMQAVWDCPVPAERGDIEKNLQHSMAPTTLLTMLSRLGEKGFLMIEKTGRRSCYRPLVTRQEYLAAQSKRFLQNLCGGSLSVFANALCDSGLTREEIAQLRELLEGDAL